MRWRGGRLRLAVWNITRFERLFDRDDRLLLDEEPSAMPGVTRRAQGEAVATVLRAVDADLFAILEAPNTGRTQSASRALARFAGRFGLRQRAALEGVPSPTHQEIALLYDPDRLAALHSPATGAAAPPADPPLFSRPPLEARVAMRPEGPAFRLVAVHLKATRRETAAGESPGRTAASDTRRAAQARWLRARVRALAAAGEELVIGGDFNDGPAFNDGLGGAPPPAAPAVVAGLADAGGEEGGGPRLVAPWLALTPPGGEGAHPSPPPSVIFAEGGGALFDHLLVSPGLAAHGHPRWRVWNPDRDPACREDAALAAALRAASDHVPVSIDLHFAGCG